MVDIEIGKGTLIELLYIQLNNITVLEQDVNSPFLRANKNVFSSR